jgi:hypothetical protein
MVLIRVQSVAEFVSLVVPGCSRRAHWGSFVADLILDPRCDLKEFQISDLKFQLRDSKFADSSVFYVPWVRVSTLRFFASWRLCVKRATQQASQTAHDFGGRASFASFSREGQSRI